jgi:isochorismate pyruvate lyase
MKECSSLDEVRMNIDRIDQEIVKLLAIRGGYVKQTVRFKKTVNDVKAPGRVEAVIDKVRTLAAENNFNPDIVESIYRTMIECFIEDEMREMRITDRVFNDEPILPS